MPISNMTMKFGQVIEYDKEIVPGRLVPGLFPSS